MGLVIKRTENNIEIAVWKITESLEELEKMSGNLDSSDYKSKKRKKEFLSVRLLLKNLCPLSTISYKKNGAPWISKHKCISISHSGDLACIIISKHNNGIDIEEISEKPLRLYSKFGNNPHLEGLTKEKATLIWSIKESVFKWQKQENINFKKDIIISNFNVSEKGKIDLTFKNNKLTANYFKIENKFLVYVCK